MASTLYNGWCCCECSELGDLHPENVRRGYTAKWEEIVDKEACAECRHTRCFNCPVLGEENKFWLWPNNEHVGTLEEIQFREGVALKRKKWDAEKQSKGKEENAAK